MPEVTQPGGQGAAPGSPMPVRVGLIPVKVEYPFVAPRFYADALRSITRSKPSKQHAPIDVHVRHRTSIVAGGDGVIGRFGPKR